IQVGAPGTVSSSLQRLGRSGGRPGTRRNMLLLSGGPGSFLQNLGILLLAERGYIEPITPPAHPRHIDAQHLLALALHEGAYALSGADSWWGDLSLMGELEEVVEYLVEKEFLTTDGAMAFIGPNAEETFGRLHFRELLSSFTVAFEM